MSCGQILQSRMLQCTLQNKKRAAEKQEEALFKESPPPEDCPICFLPLPLETGETIFKSCCGKIICSGCIDAMREEASLEPRKNPVWEKIRFGSGQKNLESSPTADRWAHSRH